jgi:uncharacterized membrane protein YuzA (DUF378 family)
MDRTALIFVIIGAIIWGFVGIFAWNPITWMIGGEVNTISRIIYTLVGLGGIWCVKLLFRERVITTSKHHS